MTDHTTGGTLDGEALTVMKSMTPPLNGANYTSWARGVFLSLAGKGKEHHLSGLPNPSLIEIKEQKTDPKTTTNTVATVSDPQNQHKNDPKWKREDIQVMTWLLSTMNPEVSQEFLFCESAQEIWENAQQRFGQAQNFAHLYNIKQEINQVKKGTKTISELIGQLKTKWDIINMLNPITTDLKTLQERAQREKIFQFLAALDPSYDSIRSQILLSPDLSSFNQVAAMVQQEESRRVAMNSLPSPVENHAYTTSRRHPNSNPNPNPNPKATREQEATATAAYCDHCNKAGHDREGCWVLHPHLKPARGRGRGGGGGARRGGKNFTLPRGGGGGNYRAHAADTEAKEDVNSWPADAGLHHADQPHTGMNPTRIRNLIQELNSMLTGPDSAQKGESFSGPKNWEEDW
ncbi:01P13-1 [Rhynchospora pubera]|uniref:01P13-1 n=1 Tax=Rhynchospora pubera TaxID=906938 RepID=A0AAV8EHJ7_9POAL|nr:01P13-1 [Rhynchospora pubera]